MFNRNLVLRLVVAVIPIVGAVAIASFARGSEFPGLFVLVLAIVVGSVALVVMRGGPS
jgi:hypothetical protein